jgi:transposase
MERTMKDTETKLTCFKLRAEGNSLATIADTVGVRRQTVANWLNQYAEEVENLRQIELDALREACWMTTHARIERVSARFEKITAELDKRDFSDFSTEKLLELEQKTRAELAREFPEPRIRSEEQLSDAKARRTAPDPHLYSPLLPQGGDTTLLLEPEESGNGRKRSRGAE